MKAAEILMWGEKQIDVFYLNQTELVSVNGAEIPFVLNDSYVWMTNGVCYSIQGDSTLLYEGDYASIGEKPYYQDGTYIYFTTTSGDIRTYLINTDGTLTLTATKTANVLSFIGFEDKLFTYDTTGDTLRLFTISSGILTNSDSTTGVGSPWAMCNGFLITADDLYLYSINISNNTIIELGQSANIYDVNQYWITGDNSKYVFRVQRLSGEFDPSITTWGVDNNGDFTELFNKNAVIDGDGIFTNNDFLYTSTFYDGITKYKIEANGSLTYVGLVIGTGVTTYINGNDDILLNIANSWTTANNFELGNIRLREYQ